MYFGGEEVLAYIWNSDSIDMNNVNFIAVSFFFQVQREILESSNSYMVVGATKVNVLRLSKGTQLIRGRFICMITIFEERAS